MDGQLPGAVRRIEIGAGASNGKPNTPCRAGIEAPNATQPRERRGAKPVTEWHSISAPHPARRKTECWGYLFDRQAFLFSSPASLTRIILALVIVELTGSPVVNPHVKHILGTPSGFDTRALDAAGARSTTESSSPQPVSPWRIRREHSGLRGRQAPAQATTPQSRATSCVGS